MEEQDAPQDRPDRHGTLDDRNHIKRHHWNCFCIQIKSESGDETEQQDADEAHHIRAYASQFSLAESWDQRQESKGCGQREDGKIAVDRIQFVCDHLLGKHVNTCADTGEDEQHGQRKILMEKYIQRTTVPGNAEHAGHTEDDAENFPWCQFVFK